MPWDPMRGERLAPAWIAARRLLRDLKWHDWAEVRQAMIEASDLEPRTCDNLLYAAIKHNHIHRMGKYDRRTRKDGRVLGLGFEEFKR